MHPVSKRRNPFCLCRPPLAAISGYSCASSASLTVPSCCLLRECPVRVPEVPSIPGVVRGRRIAQGNSLAWSEKKRS